MSRMAEIMDAAIARAEVSPDKTVWMIVPTQQRAYEIERRYPNLPANLLLKPNGTPSDSRAYRDSYLGG